MLSLDSTNETSNIVRFKPVGQSFHLYGSGDPIPDHLRHKLSQVPTIFKHLMGSPITNVRNLR